MTQLTDGVWILDSKDKESFRIHKFVAASEAEAEAFKAGIEWVNDSSLEVLSISCELLCEEDGYMYVVIVAEQRN